MTLSDKISAKISLLKDRRKSFIRQARPASWEFQIATWFGSGLLIPAPGTWGTLGGLLFGILLLSATSALVTGLVALALLAIGLLATRRIEERSAEHDSSFIVIDEVVAILLVLAALPVFSLLFVTAAFLLFRLFDAAKPWPVNWLDRQIGGAWGVMLDDLMAGLYSLLILWGLHGFI